jgi:hypothetical protein
MRLSAHPKATPFPGRQIGKRGFEILLMVIVEVAIGH